MDAGDRDDVDSELSDWVLVQLWHMSAFDQMENQFYFQLTRSVKMDPLEVKLLLKNFLGRDCLRR